MGRVPRYAVGFVFTIALALVLPLIASASPGSVTIRDLVALSPSVKFAGSSSFGFRAITTQVGEGGSVIFSNRGGEAHTVSSFSVRVPIPIAPGTSLLIPYADGVFDSSPSVPPILLGGEGTFPDQLNPGIPSRSPRGPSRQGSTSSTASSIRGWSASSRSPRTARPAPRFPSSTATCSRLGNSSPQGRRGGSLRALRKSSHGCPSRSPTWVTS